MAKDAETRKGRSLIHRLSEGHQTSPSQAGCALGPCLWPCLRGCVDKLSCDLQARLLWNLTPASWVPDAPYCYQHCFHGWRKASDPGARRATASVPELVAATAFSLLGLACLSPWWLEKGTECRSTKDCSIWNGITLIHNFQRAFQSSLIIGRSMVQILLRNS